jgi:hypothetical protein
MHDHIAIANPGQEVGYWISHDHTKYLLYYNLPARLFYPWQFTFVCESTETDAAHPEFAHISPGPAANLAPVISTNFELLIALLFGNESLFSH